MKIKNFKPKRHANLNHATYNINLTNQKINNN